MNNQTKPPSAAQQSCQQTRLAQSFVAAVDICDCGMMQVHVGSCTLRMAPEAVTELMSTLGQAVARHAATRAGAEPASIAFRTRNRGEA